jgi:hypothetical protein|nr:MAG TPA: hypothetical protein [Caudoviricetes sp.]
MIIAEYKQGRNKNFFLRENEGVYYLEKITKACGFTLKAGTEKEVEKYINDNGFDLVRVIDEN